MKNVQGSFFTGTVTVVVQGEHPEYFFQMCMDQLGIVLWDIKKTANDTCEGKVRVRHVKDIRMLRRQGSYKLSFKHKQGYPFIWRNWLKSRHIVLSVCLSFLFIYALSNMIWSIQISGVSSDIEEKIIQTLEKEEVNIGGWMFSVPSASDIQFTLTQEIPELLWVGVEKKGTTFLLEGIEKERIEKIEKNSPRNLIAKKNGVITYMHVSKGDPVVQVNDTVKKGDPLVLGTIQRIDEENEEHTMVAAEGEIIAETWYEVDVEIPLKQRRERVTGKYKNKWFVDTFFLQIPIWGWGNPKYEHSFIQEHEHPLYFLQWKTPFTVKKQTIHNQELLKEELTVEQAIKIGIQQIYDNLMNELGPNIDIKDEIILHETVENGKVKIQLLITVEEDIVKEEPLLEGD